MFGRQYCRGSSRRQLSRTWSGAISLSMRWRASFRRGGQLSITLVGINVQAADIATEDLSRMTETQERREGWIGIQDITV